MKTPHPIIPLLRVLPLLLSVCFGPLARAADGNPPDRMSYQGYLVDGNGQPLGQTNTGPKNFDVIFRIWNDQSAITPANRLWTEQQTVTVDRGYFSILLGEGSAFSSEARSALSTVFTNQLDASDRFVEMTVKGIGPGGGDATILPRVRLLASPYAFLARNAISAANLVNSMNGPIVTVTSTNVGINTSNPGSSLDVNGTVKASAVQAATVTANTGFVGPGTIPVGGIIMWSGDAVPEGWAICDGGTYSGRNTPDLRGRFVLGAGAGAGLTERLAGQTGGAEAHALSVAELPAHSHSVNPPSTTTSDNSHNHTMDADTGGGVTSSGTDRVIFNSDGGDSSHTTDSTTHSHTVDIASFNSGNTGSGAAHNTMPPFYVLAFIMRVQ